MKFIKTDDTITINEFRTELYQRFSAPIDGMWEKLYIASAQPYLIEKDTYTIGYCCIDNKACLLQIFLCAEYNHLMNSVVQSLIESTLISSASLSSIEPVSFNISLFHSKSIQTNTLCFQYSTRQLEHKSSLNIALVSKKDIQEIKAFFKQQIGFDDNFGYTENLVQRKELYQIKESGSIITTSECRLSDSQPEFADLGVIVNKAYQGKGIATKVLYQQANRAMEANRKPICSTTYDNIASQKAIERAGFYCSHIIFDINFTATGTQEK